MIKFQNVDFDYNKRKSIFQNLNITLENGNIYGLLGSNATGKTSFLKMIAGIIFPKVGSCSVDGHNSQKRNPAMLKELYFLLEEFQAPQISIKEFVKVYAPFYPNFNKNQFLEYLQEFQLAEYEKFTDLSLGQKKKALISFAIATNTKVLLMDEPTNGLDIPSKSQFRKIIASIVTDDRLIVISTHQVRDLESLIDPIIILDNNQILIHASIEEISEKLCFQNVSSLNGNTEIFYNEPSLKGFSIVRKNTKSEESKVDLEHLFNASLANKNEIKELFTI